MKVLWCLQLLLLFPIAIARMSIFKHSQLSGKVFSALTAGTVKAEHDDISKENVPVQASHHPRTGYFKALVAGYNTQLEKNPYLTKMITSSLVGGLGDVLVQMLGDVDSVKELNYRRTAVMMLVGGFYVAPLMHNWFNFLSKLPLPQRLSPFGMFFKSIVTMLMFF